MRYEGLRGRLYFDRCCPTLSPGPLLKTAVQQGSFFGSIKAFARRRRADGRIVLAFLRVATSRYISLTPSEVPSWSALRSMETGLDPILKVNVSRGQLIGRRPRKSYYDGRPKCCPDALWPSQAKTAAVVAATGCPRSFFVSDNDQLPPIRGAQHYAAIVSGARGRPQPTTDATESHEHARQPPERIGTQNAFVPRPRRNVGAAHAVPPPAHTARADRKRKNERTTEDPPV